MPPRRYTIRQTRQHQALAGLLQHTLLAAETAVVVGGCEPRAVCAELDRVQALLDREGWRTEGRAKIMARASLWTKAR